MAMDELEISKIVGAGCAALLVFVGLGQLGSAIVGVDQLDEPAYVIEIAQVEEAGGEVEEAMPIGQLMAMAVVDDGAKVFRKCSACHKMDDGANGVGPHLYGVVGRPIAGVDGYSYSNALAEKDGPWDFAALDGFLEAPKKWAPGTKMGFNGLSKPEDRASVIAWLNEQSAAPLPMPAVETVEMEPDASETAALEPVEQIVPGGVESGEISQVDGGDAGTDMAIVNPEAPREAEMTEAQIGDAADSEGTAEVEMAETARPVVEPEAEMEVADPPAEVEVAVVDPVETAQPEVVQAEAVQPEVVVAPVEKVELADAVASATFMIGADAAKGAKVFRKCKACHRVEEDGGNGVGPNLYGVVGRVIASHDGFNYSDALKAKDGAWDYENLAAFLAKPKDWAPGTKMAYAGLRKEQDRADVIAYLNEQSADPLPLPE